MSASSIPGRRFKMIFPYPKISIFFDLCPFELGFVTHNNKSLTFPPTYKTVLFVLTRTNTSI